MELQAGLPPPGRPVRDILAPEAISARLEGDLQLPVRFKELAGDLKTAKPEKIGDATCMWFLASTPEGLW